MKKTFLIIITLWAVPHVFINALAMEGKMRAPGVLSPQARVAAVPTPVNAEFVMARDPFERPTEILPDECLPSNPLCKYDCSQTKVVGIIKSRGGTWKAYLEDADGRGYAVAVGDAIGAGRYSVISINYRGVIFVDGKTMREIEKPMLADRLHGLRREP